MKDKANPLALYHQRQIENQATPVHLIGSDPLNIQTDSVIIEQGGATEVTLEAVEARLEAVESLLSGTLTTQLSGSNGPLPVDGDVRVSGSALTHNGRLALVPNEEAALDFPAGFANLVVRNFGPGAVHVAVDETASAGKFPLGEGETLSGLRGQKLHLLALGNAPTVAYLGE